MTDLRRVYASADQLGPGFGVMLRAQVDGARERADRYDDAVQPAIAAANLLVGASLLYDQGRDQLYDDRGLDQLANLCVMAALAEAGRWIDETALATQALTIDSLADMPWDDQPPAAGVDG